MSKEKKQGRKKLGGLKTLLIIALICTAIYWVFFASLSFMTRHGKVVVVPKYVGQNFTEAKIDIEHKGYRLEVDSSYHPDFADLEILDQQPKEGQEVKKGRTLFLTINKATAPEIEMPNLVNLSFRSAEMVLTSNKLKLGDTITKPDLADGAVIEMLYKGRPIKQYDKIKQGETISLVIGGGLKEMQFEVPDLVGFTYDEVISLLSSYSLHPNISYDGYVVDTFGVVVIGQNPKPINEDGSPNMIKENHVIHIKMKDYSAGQQPMENPQDPNSRRYNPSSNRTGNPRSESSRTSSQRQDNSRQENSRQDNSETNRKQPKYQYSNN